MKQISFDIHTATIFLFFSLRIYLLFFLPKSQHDDDDDDDDESRIAQTKIFNIKINMNIGISMQ